MKGIRIGNLKDGKVQIFIPPNMSNAPDGAMGEVHPQPEDALCDGPQQIRVGEFARFADEIRTLVALMGKTVG